MPDPDSLISSLSALPAEERQAVLASLSDREAAAILYDWRAWARPNQRLPEGDWEHWLVLAGRGFGKTRTGAEAIREMVEAGGQKSSLRIALVAPTARDARKVMVEGESGILACSAPWMRPHYEPSKTELTWPNGAKAWTYSAEEPDRLRGPQHHACWCDELASWTHMGETWDMLQMGLRLSDNPRSIITTTPRPKDLIRSLRKDPSTVVTSGSTYENAGNLSRKWLDRTLKRYEGTRLGRQELYAEILDDVPGALWTRAIIERCRRDTYPDLAALCIAIDPAVTAGENSDATGIIVIAIGVDAHLYVLRDLTCRLPPHEWAVRAINAYRQYRANFIVAEVNNGGDLVQSLIHAVDPRVPVYPVHASRKKFTRAEPIGSMYEQDRVHHVRRPETPNEFADLEDEMCSFVPHNLDGSPDRVDALVWGATALAIDPPRTERIVEYDDRVRISPY